MSILIGHSSIDENRKARGGQAGDQNGKEVYTREWYKASWNVLLRCKDSAMAEKMAIACEQACANDNIGYDQNQRNSLHTEAKKVGYDLSKVAVKCESDCSSFMCICAIAAGIPESALYQGGNMRTTRNIRSAFKATGKFEILTDSKYLTSDTYLKRGDILVNEGSHTVMVLGNGAQATREPVSEQIKPSNDPVIGTAIAKSAMNVRTGPSTSYKATGTVKRGSKVEVLDITSNNWYKIVWAGAAEGYAYVSNVSNKYFDYISINSKSVTPTPTTSFKVRITASSLYVRTGPGTIHKARTVVHKGENYEIVEETTDNRNVKWGLLKQYSTNRDGWISMSYAQKI